MAKLARFRDVGTPGVETRPYMAGAYRSRMGRSSVDITCPFCLGVVTAYVWSLPNGKRCPCGALMGSLGQAHKRVATPLQGATGAPQAPAP